MDDLDRRLIQHLQRDGRAPSATLARELGVSEGTVRRRLRLLRQTSVIRIVPIADPYQMGLLTEALVAIRTAPGKVEDVAGRLARCAEVVWASTSTGSYDVFCWVAVPSPSELSQHLHDSRLAHAEASAQSTYSLYAWHTEPT